MTFGLYFVVNWSACILIWSLTVVRAKSGTFDRCHFWLDCNTVEQIPLWWPIRSMVVKKLLIHKELSVGSHTGLFISHVFFSVEKYCLVHCDEWIFSLKVAKKCKIRTLVNHCIFYIMPSDSFKRNIKNSF